MRGEQIRLELSRCIGNFFFHRSLRGKKENRFVHLINFIISAQTLLNLISEISCTDRLERVSTQMGSKSERNDETFPFSRERNESVFNRGCESTLEMIVLNSNIDSEKLFLTIGRRR